MRNLTVAALFLMIVMSCKDKEMPEIATDDITGKWLWEGSAGGFGGGVFKPQKGERIILEFTKNKDFYFSRNDTVLQKAKYRIEKMESIYGERLGIYYENATPSYFKFRPIIGPVISHLTNKRLSMSDNFYDGFGSAYTKIQ